LVDNFLIFNSLYRGKNEKKVSHSIWLIKMECIWMERNNIIFNGKIVNTTEIGDLIIRLSWSWFICREGSSKKKLLPHIDGLTHSLVSNVFDIDLL